MAYRSSKDQTLGKITVVVLGISFLLLLLCSPSAASDPHSAYYSDDNNNILWFIQVSDVHIGARGGQDSGNLQWLVTS